MTCRKQNFAVSLENIFELYEKHSGAIMWLHCLW